jgi:hypothetical protein
MHREKTSMVAGVHHRAARQLIGSNFDSPGWKSVLFARHKSLQALKSQI